MRKVLRAIEVRNFILSVRSLRRRRLLLDRAQREAADLKDLSRKLLVKVRGIP
ncbi:unnamed protein product [marine sediment metagenome]|uniref:Uncharacterized protein n=1 Tax=marine sediment metagenome TaxID=412755 RepID=X1KRL3_9ZZZZ